MAGSIKPKSRPQGVPPGAPVPQNREGARPVRGAAALAGERGGKSPKDFGPGQQANDSFVEGPATHQAARGDGKETLAKQREGGAMLKPASQTPRPAPAKSANSLKPEARTSPTQQPSTRSLPVQAAPQKTLNAAVEHIIRVQKEMVAQGPPQGLANRQAALRELIWLLRSDEARQGLSQVQVQQLRSLAQQAGIDSHQPIIDVALYSSISAQTHAHVSETQNTSEVMRAFAAHSQTTTAQAPDPRELERLRALELESSLRAKENKKSAEGSEQKKEGHESEVISKISEGRRHSLRAAAAAGPSAPATIAQREKMMESERNSARGKTVSKELSGPEIIAPNDRGKTGKKFE